MRLIKCLFFLVLFVSCKKDPETEPDLSKARNIIVLVIDGPRYSETWGDSTYTNIPHYKYLTNFGSVFNDFSNKGMTNTVNGHIAICTGSYDTLQNNGSETPKYPSFMQYWLKKSNANANKAWVITTKDKLEILANCEEAVFKDKYLPSTDCGNSGLGSGYREDSTTINKVITLLKTKKPKLMVINLKQPDMFGHSGVWLDYIRGIKESDDHMWALWNYIKSDDYYKNNTDLIITNDHGRHLDSVNDGFVSHGDGCEGCRHITLLAIGPDFRDNYKVNNAYSQIDLTATLAKLLDIQMPYCKGKVIDEILIK